MQIKEGPEPLISQVEQLQKEVLSRLQLLGGVPEMLFRRHVMIEIEKFLPTIRNLLVINGIDSIYTTPEAYDSEGLKILQLYHWMISFKYGTDQGYDRYCGIEGVDPISHKCLYSFNQLENGSGQKQTELMFFSGELASCPQELIAAFIHDQVANYVNQGTMGSFPKGDVIKEELLTSVMTDGCSADDAIVLIYIKTTGGNKHTIKPVSGCKLKFGQSNESITALNGSPQSNIPTFSSLFINNDGLNEMNKDLADDEARSLTEKDIVCPSRLFSNRVPEWLTTLLRSNRVSVAQIIMAMLPQVYVAAAKRSGRSIPKAAVYDTHLQAIVDFTQSSFGAKVIANNGSVEATPAVTNQQTRAGGVLHYHYSDAQIRHNISLAFIPTKSFLSGSQKILESVNSRGVIELPLLSE